jgi:hypothetical protein
MGLIEVWNDSWFYTEGASRTGGEGITAVTAPVWTGRATVR